MMMIWKLSVAGLNFLIGVERKLKMAKWKCTMCREACVLETKVKSLSLAIAYLNRCPFSCCTHTPHWNIVVKPKKASGK